VLRLTNSVQESDPPFLRNKFAQIWTEVAKRIWGRTWTDMDEQLVRLWGASYVHQEFVLTVLETLSDDIFHHDDYIAGMRQELGTSLSRIFLPEEAFLSWEKLEQFEPMRFGGEGWMMRLCRFLKHCLDQKQDPNPMVYSCTLKILAALNSVCSWILPKALVSSYCIDGLKFTLIEGDTRLRIVRLNWHPPEAV
jgi:exportin-5